MLSVAEGGIGNLEGLSGLEVTGIAGYTVAATEYAHRDLRPAPVVPVAISHLAIHKCQAERHVSVGDDSIIRVLGALITFSLYTSRADVLPSDPFLPGTRSDF